MGVELIFRGLMAPVFTPFTSDGSLNLSVIPQYAQYLKNGGVDGVLVNGTSGEGMSQTVTEREQLAEAWVAAAGRTKQTIMVQVGGTNLEDVKRLAAHSEKIGAHALLCLPELYYRPTSVDDVVNYLKIVSQAAPNTPLFYYHIPMFTHVNFSVEEILRKGDVVPTLNGVKFSEYNMDAAIHCTHVTTKKYLLFVGMDTILAPLWTMGFQAVLATSLNMFPALNKAVIDATVSGDAQKIQGAQKILTKAVYTISQHGPWVPTMKAAMNLLTPINVGPVREPLRPITIDQEKKIVEDIRDLKL